MTKYVWESDKEPKKERKWSVTIWPLPIKKYLKRLALIFSLIVLFYSGVILLSIIFDVAGFCSYYIREIGRQMWVAVFYQQIYDIPAFSESSLFCYWINVYTSSAPFLWKLICLIPINIACWIMIIVLSIPVTSD